MKVQPELVWYITAATVSFIVAGASGTLFYYAIKDRKKNGDKV